MTSTSQKIHGEFLRQQDRVRALALSLTNDPNSADDVLQDVALLLLARPPRTAHCGSELWSWLRAVTRTLARQRVRSQRRRLARERCSAQPEAQPSFLERLMVADDARQIRRAIAELREPYRRTISMRLLQGRSIRSIARREQVEEAAVRMRLVRGLRQLREMLETRRRRLSLPAWIFLGHQGRWLAALGGVVLIVASATFVSLARSSTPAPTTASLATKSSARLDPDTQAPVPRSRNSGSRSSASKLTVLGPAQLQTVARDCSFEIDGKAFWSDGSAASGVQLGLVGVSCPPCRERRCSQHRTRSDATGCFRIRCPPESSYIVTHDPDLTTVLAAHAFENSPLNSVAVVIARHRVLQGRVLDEGGTPVAGARTRWLAPEHFAHRFPEPVASAKKHELHGSTDDSGRISLSRYPSVEGGRVRVTADGFSDLTIPLATPPLGEVTMTLARTAADTISLRGFVWDPQGLPVQEALIGAGLQRGISASDGHFALVVPKLRWTGELCVVTPGAGPALLDVPAGSEETIEVRLVSRPNQIRGRVVDRTGRALAGIRVAVQELEAAFLERGELWTLEGLAAAAPAAWPPPTTTAQNGRFALAGLLPRQYTLIAIDPTTLESVSIQATPGQSLVELQFHRDRGIGPVQGHLLRLNQTPVAAARVRLLRDVSFATAGDRKWATHRMVCEAGVTGPQGRFRIPRVAPGASIHFESPEVFPVVVNPHAADRVIAAARCRLQLVQVSEEASSVQILSDREETLPVAIALGDLPTRAALSGGRSEVLTVPENARWVLFQDSKGHPLGRLSLQLTHGLLNQISVGDLKF